MKRKEFQIKPGQVWCLEFANSSMGETWYYVVVDIDRSNDTVSFFNLYTEGYNQGKISFDKQSIVLKDHNGSRSYRDDLYWKFIC